MLNGVAVAQKPFPYGVSSCIDSNTPSSWEDISLKRLCFFLNFAGNKRFRSAWSCATYHWGAQVSISDRSMKQESFFPRESLKE